MSWPRETPNWCMRPFYLWDKYPLFLVIWLVKSMEVYIPYPPLDLKLWPIKRKHMFITITLQLSITSPIVSTSSHDFLSWHIKVQIKIQIIWIITMNFNNNPKSSFMVFNLVNNVIKEEILSLTYNNFPTLSSRERNPLIIVP